MRIPLRWIGGFAGAFGLIDHRFTVMLVIITLLFVVTGQAEQQPAAPRPAAPARRAAPPPAATPTAPAGMTNADVVNMVAAGLSEQIVVGAIRDAKTRSFDVTPNGLIALKKGGVSDAVIGVMMNPTAAAATPAPTPPPAAATATAPPAAAATPATEGDVPAIVASEPGLYFMGDQGVVRIEAKTPYQTRTGSTLASRLTLGIKASRINAMLQGLRSDLQVGTTPQFYIHLDQVLGTTESVGEYYLVRFTVKESQGRREIEVASRNFTKFQSGFPEKDLFQIEAKRVMKDVYLITPKSALSGGEYGLLQLPQGGAASPSPKKIFDFGVR